MTTWVNSQFPRPDFHRQVQRHYGLQTQNDIRRFLADFKARLDVRGLAVRGVTTDGSELYPEPLKELWPDVPHQVCEFHVIKEITKAVLHALAATRKKLRDRIPKQRAADPARPSEPSPARPPCNNSR